MANLLATKRGRLTTFFLLYITEGIPLGFAATAIATQMRRNGVPPDQIGAFVASFYFPWAWKWAAGPVVDLVYSDRLGRRRAWIVATQIGMALTLLWAMRFDFTTEIALFTTVLLVHNCIAAVQDVAIDALAVGALKDEERGLANGLMFAGASIGQMIGGSGVLLLTKYVPSFNYTFFFVAGCILAVTFAVAIRLREPPTPRPADPSLGVGAELKQYVVTAFKSVFGNRVAIAAMVLALLPAGPYALALALQSNLAVELGLSNEQVGYLAAISTMVGAAGCVAGGWLSDKLGRRKALALYIVLMTLPNLVLAAAMYQRGWVMPIDPRAPNRPLAGTTLLTVFWSATIVYALFNGLMYGARSALYMDISNPAVAATQFTAYMAMMNLVISYTALWHGQAIVRWGYPLTLLADAAFGTIAIALLPLTLTKVPYARPAVEEDPGRAFEPVPPGAK